MRAPHTLAVSFPTSRPRPLTGAIELVVSEAATADRPRADRVTAILNAVFETVDSAANEGTLVSRLTSGARAWLLARAASVFSRDVGWFQARCTSCSALFDFQASPAAAPRKQAGPGFPVVEVPTSLGPRKFEAPNGLHEVALARQPGGDPRRMLAGLCGLADDAEAEAERLTEADLDRIETLLDDASPDFADTVSTRCPECAGDVEVTLDPLDYAFPHSGTLLHEAHLIAGAYGWSEAEILALPRTRRRIYADLIKRDVPATGKQR